MYNKAKKQVDKARDKAGSALKWYSLRKRAVHGWAHVVLPLALLFALIAVKASGWDWAENLQNRAFDAFVRLKPRIYRPVPVRVLDIDDESLSRLGQWPWPRTLLARLVEKLGASGAAAIAFDAVFAEPDRTSPASVLASWPAIPEVLALKRAGDRLPDNDRSFARAVRGAAVVAGFTLTETPNGAAPMVKASFAYGGGDPAPWLRPDFPGAVVNLPEIERAAAGNGSFSFMPEPDGVVRRVPLLFLKGGRILPSLVLEALRVAQGASGYQIKSSGASGETGANTGISKVKAGEFVIPTDGSGKVWVYPTAEAPGRTLPAWRVLEKDFDPEAVRGTILFVGTSAAGLKDLRVTALDPRAPGVDVHANAAEQIMLGDYLERPDWAAGAEIVYMLLLGGLLVALLPRLGALTGAGAAGAGIAAALYASWWSFSSRGYLLDPLFPCATVLSVYVSSSLISYLKSETERRQVRQAFNRYMHPRLVEELARHPEKLRLGGETRNMTILFCDIRGFTTLSEQYDAHGLTRVINRFLTPMTEIIMQRLGYVDKYIGDCIMAFWNAPLDDERHADNACEAALSMHERLEELNALWKAEADKAGTRYIPIKIGVGLNSGDCCVGNMGADQRFNYSVLGDDVNLASRLEGQSKPYGVSTVIGPRTREQAPDFAALELDLIKVKGKTVPVRIFALLGRKDLKESAAFREREAAHNAMLAAYRGREWDKAGELLEQCRKASPNLSVLYAIYEDRIKNFKAAPPAPDWDGTYTATSK